MSDNIVLLAKMIAMAKIDHNRDSLIRYVNQMGVVLNNLVQESQTWTTTKSS